MFQKLLKNILKKANKQIIIIMPTSKKRGGKKAHNQRVLKRNETVAKNRLAMERQFMSMLKEQIQKQNPETEDNA